MYIATYIYTIVFKAVSVFDCNITFQTLYDEQDINIPEGCETCGKSNILKLLNKKNKRRNFVSEHSKC